MDNRLEELLKPPIPPNTFLKAHFEGLVLVMPDKIVVKTAKIRSLTTKL